MIDFTENNCEIFFVLNILEPEKELFLQSVPATDDPAGSVD